VSAFKWANPGCKDDPDCGCGSSGGGETVCVQAFLCIDESGNDLPAGGADVAVTQGGTTRHFTTDADGKVCFTVATTPSYTYTVTKAGGTGGGPVSPGGDGYQKIFMTLDVGYTCFNTCCVEDQDGPPYLQWNPASTLHVTTPAFSIDVHQTSGTTWSGSVTVGATGHNDATVSFGDPDGPGGLPCTWSISWSWFRDDGTNDSGGADGAENTADCSTGDGVNVSTADGSTATS
jgi:hypothetical protein